MAENARSIITDDGCKSHQLPHQVKPRRELLLMCQPKVPGGNVGVGKVLKGTSGGVEGSPLRKNRPCPLTPDMGVDGLTAFLFCAFFCLVVCLSSNRGFQAHYRYLVGINEACRRG